MRLLTQLWRFIRVSGAAAAAQAASGAHTNPRLAYIALGIGAAETLYRQAVPPRDQSKIAALISAVRTVYRQAQADQHPVSPPATPAAAVAVGAPTLITPRT
jgi:hypothetical protein